MSDNIVYISGWFLSQYLPAWYKNIHLESGNTTDPNKYYQYVSNRFCSLYQEDKGWVISSYTCPTKGLKMTIIWLVLQWRQISIMYIVKILLSWNDVLKIYSKNHPVLVCTSTLQSVKFKPRACFNTGTSVTTVVKNWENLQYVSNFYQKGSSLIC